MENSQPTLPSRPRQRPGRAYVATALAAGSLGLATLAVMGSPASAAGAGRADTKARTSTKVVVSEVTTAKYGRVLVDHKGLALYYDTANKPSHFACTGDCLKAWPPLVLPKGQKAALAGTGVTGLGTVRGPSGLQVTWEGKALYTFVEDSKGTVKGQGIGHVWFVTQLSAAPISAPTSGTGAPKTTAPPTTAPPTTAPATTPSTTAPPMTTPPTTTPPMTVPPAPVSYTTPHSNV
jgi:predicted lipoprotein with Yx(FWY)xxD motif